MNKIYKSVWNASSGQWVAASEIAKGKTKSSKSTVTKVAGVFALTMLSASAWAGTCASAVNGKVSCTQDAAGNDVSYVATGVAAPIAVNAVGTMSKPGLAALDVTDSNITGIGSSHALFATGEGASVTLNGTNTITLGAFDDTAVLVMGGAGASNITINGRLNIDINRPGVVNSDGLEAHGFDTNISHHGVGTITTNGGNAIWTAAGNNAKVLVGGGAILNVSGSDNNGIRASANKNVNVSSNATITTTGNNGKGIWAYTNLNGGNIDLTNTGNITTTGLASDGIMATTTAGSTSSGKITIRNSSDITTSNASASTGRGSHALYAVINHQGDSEGIEINQTGGKLTTTGYDSHGILVLSQAISGDITINVRDTDIDVKHHNSDGIDVQRQSSGNVNQVSNVNINVTTHGGEIKTLDATVSSTGGANYGIVAYQYDAAAGNINIINNGTKISTGTGADGLGANSDAINASFKNATATGNIIIINKGDLSTQAGKAQAINAIHNGNGNISIANHNSLTVSGNDASAINATSVGVGDIVVRHEAGASIISTGNTESSSRTDAINAYKGVNATGNINIYVNGDISTTGANRAAGAYAQHQGVGNATVIGTGNITASASNKSGSTNIYSYGLAATVSDSANAAGNASVAYSQGTIQTGGDNAYALYAGVVGKSGNVAVENSGTLKTTGTGSHAIWARNETTDVSSATSGNSVVINTGRIETSGTTSHGIYALARGADAGKVIVNNSGSITTSGFGGIGVFASVNNAGGDSAGIEINQTGSTITTTGQSAIGVNADTYAKTGDINVVVSNTVMDLKGHHSDGINVQQFNTTVATNTNLNVTTHGGEIKLLDGATTPTATNNYGIVVRQYGEAAGDINIINNGTKISTGLGQDGVAPDSPAIDAQFIDARSTGHITIISTGELSTQGAGEGTSGITAINRGTGNIEVASGGSITTSGKGATGIYAKGSTGDVSIYNTGAIVTSGADVAAKSHGIFGRVDSAKSLQIVNEGKIHIQGSSSRGILASGAAGAQITVLNTGEILHDAATAYQYGIEVQGGDNTTKTITNDGKISGGNFGIVAWNGFTAHTGGKSTINIGAQGSVDSDIGITVDMSDENTINIAQGGQVNGKSTALLLRSQGSATPNDTVNNAGIITSDKDQIVRTEFTAPGATLSFINDGIIIGFMTLGSEDTTFTNNSPNSWNIRNYADTNGDGLRDTKAVAISDFGGGSDALINTASGTIRLAAVNGAATIDTTGEYIPVGALSSAQEGIVHGQILNLNRFENAGLIDLTDNGLAGDVLVISGGTAAGTNGNGDYISNGGAIKLDAVLNQGGSISQSDIFVVDNVKLGTAATKIYINPNMTSTGGQTEGDGIKLVQVLGTQDTGSFTLGAPVTYGGYEYLLYPDSAAGADGWYLRNYNIADKERYDWFRNPNIGSYLGNQYAAANMFNQNILDRRDNVRAPDQTLWIRANHNEINSNILKGLQAVEIQTSLIQVGADLLKRDDIVAGVYAGYGDSKIDNRSKQTGTTASGKVTGYHIGAYGSWMPEQNKGPYADLWGYYAWYDNKLTGQAQSLGATQYDSTGYALSAEVGYGFELNKKENGSAWILEPHAQLTYTNISADDFSDKNLTHFSGNQSSGVQTRLGGRLYGQLPAGQKGVTPFVEVNWLHNAMDNSVRVNNLEFDSSVGKNVGEVKIGVQGQVSNKLNVFGHMGAQRGSQGFKRHEIQLGIGLDW